MTAGWLTDPAGQPLDVVGQVLDQGVPGVAAAEPVVQLCEESGSGAKTHDVC